MINDIIILLLYAIFSKNHGYRLDICETVTSQPIVLILSFAHLKLILLIFKKIMLMELTMSDL